jgi:hypothetical protein
MNCILKAPTLLAGATPGGCERSPAESATSASDVTPFIGPGLMRVGGCGHAAAPC